MMPRVAWLVPMFVTVAVAWLSGCAGVSRPAAASTWSGAWTLTDAMDLVLFDNGQCVRVPFDGKPGEAGARGYYRPTGNGVLCLFEDGSFAELAARRSGYFWTSKSPDDFRRRWQPAIRREEPQGRFIGLWRLTPEPTGEYLYVQLHSDGSARNSLLSAIGKWELWKGGALCSWPGGWRDWLSVRDDVAVHRAWPPGSSLADDPSDFSVALRVGEKPFVISP